MGGAERRQRRRRPRHLDDRLLSPGKVPGGHHRRAPQDVRLAPPLRPGGPEEPGEDPPPPGPLLRGSTASSTFTMRADSPGLTHDSRVERQGGVGQEPVRLVV